ncbi:MAG TPA: hypothetical protein VGY53_00345, partial [Isosphaeraceae bacterium]|nr:hypothetical protein [Isosphaeraceae bacterium]
APTFHFYGIRLRALDDVLMNHSWEIKKRRILDIKRGNTFPSDPFGILVDAVLRTPEATGEAPK